MSSVLPFQFEPKRSISKEETENVSLNEDEMRRDEVRVGQREKKALVCLWQLGRHANREEEHLL